MEDGFNSSPVPEIHTAVGEKFLFDTASLDAKLFKSLVGSMQSLSEAKHVRDSLMEYVANDPAHLVGFKEYADDELNEALVNVKRLYQTCTGKELTKVRVR